MDKELKKENDQVDKMLADMEKARVEASEKANQAIAGVNAGLKKLRKADEKLAKVEKKFTAGIERAVLKYLVD